MKNLRKILISGLAVCVIGCTAAGLAACKKDSSYPNYRRPADYVEPSGSTDTEFKGDYKITVMTAGGLRISGVKADIKLNGETVLSAISMNDGEIAFRATPAEYDIVIDESTLPTGYFIDTKSKTSATSGEATAIVSSKVMTTTAVSSYVYQLGDVMYDFSYTDNNGQTQVLSELLGEGSQYKAVVLNFWYIDCQPCKNEFPALQSAYENYKDSIKLIAISTSDSQRNVDSFKAENKYTFDMVEMFGNMHDHFNVTNTPSTVIIDRYGVFVNFEMGADFDSRSWNTKFARLVSDNYVQNPSSSGTSGDGSEEIVNRVEPDIPEDDYTKFPALLNGEGAAGKIIEYYGASTENDKKYNWPWISDRTGLGRPHVKTTNVNYANSFSILSATITLERGDFISYDYFTSTELGGDILYVLVNGEIVAEHSGETAAGADPSTYGWVTNRAVYTASRNKTIELSFCYLKDELIDDGEDYVAISNITIENVKNAVEAIDMKTDACSGEISGGRFAEYVKPYFNTADNFYHVKYDDGKGNTDDSILFIDYLNPTAWAELHTEDGSTFKPTKYEYVQPASLYFLLYWDYSNWEARLKDEDLALSLTIGGDRQAALTETFINSYYTCGFSPNGVIPVTEDMKELIIAFLKEDCRIRNITYHEDMWLEFCYYFMHFGNEHEIMDYSLYGNNTDVNYDEANDVYRADNGSDKLDNKVYINFVKTGSFSILNEETELREYYSLSACLKNEMFKDVNGTDYTAKLNAYFKEASEKAGELYGTVEANSELVEILKEFVAAYGYTRENDWTIFGCFYNVGDCNATTDPIPGMTFINPYTAQTGDNGINIWNIHILDGGGMLAKFVPEESGVYKFTSFDSQLGDDPHVVIYNSQYREIGYFNNLVRYDLFVLENSNQTRQDFEGYIYLNAGETYYLRVSKGLQVEGWVYYNIEYVGESYDELRVATTADGIWTYDPEHGMDFSQYVAINVDLNRVDNKYYHIDGNGVRQSVVYIDFIHPNFYEQNDHSLKWIIDNGKFNFEEYGSDVDYTTDMLQYYYKSIEGKTEDDETYGMVEASKELVDMLNTLIRINSGERPESKLWLAFATYYQHHGK